MTDKPRIALLVDADNVSPGNIEFALAETREAGHVTIRRAFGRLSAIKGREKALREMGFAAEVALPGAKAKDTADLLLAQFAVRIAERRAVDMMALVSSDTDFAAIAQAVGESGVVCIGFGKADSPASLKDAFTRFTPFPSEKKAPATEGRGAERDDLAEAAAIIRECLRPTGEARMNAIGTRLSQKLGKDYKKPLKVTTLSALLKKLAGEFEVREIKGGDGAVAAKMVRARKKA